MSNFKIECRSCMEEVSYAEIKTHACSFEHLVENVVEQIRMHVCKHPLHQERNTVVLDCPGCEVFDTGTVFDIIMESDLFRRLTTS